MKWGAIVSTTAFKIERGKTKLKKKKKQKKKKTKGRKMRRE